MKETITKSVSTKMFEDGDAINTILTLDFSGLTEDDIQEIAASACVIKWQSKARNKKSIPATDTYKVPKPGTRTVAVRAMTNEELLAELEKRGLINEVLKKVDAEYTEE